MQHGVIRIVEECMAMVKTLKSIFKFSLISIVDLVQVLLIILFVLFLMGTSTETIVHLFILFNCGLDLFLGAVKTMGLASMIIIGLVLIRLAWVKNGRG